MAWWIPLVIAGAQMAKGEYDKQQAEKKAKDRSKSSGGSSGGYSFPDFDASKYEQQDTSVIRQPELMQQSTVRTPYYQPQIGGGVDSSLQQLRLLEAQGGINRTPLPQAPEMAPQWFAPLPNKYLQGDHSVIRGR